MKINDVIRSEKLRGVFVGIGVVIAALLVFQAGIFVGYRKARFSYRWGENYHKNFGGPRGGFIRKGFGGDFANPHGAFGKIIKIDLPQIIVQGPGDAEKVILIKSDTVIRRFRDTLGGKDLKVDDSVVIVGSPNDTGEIEAKLIRVLPPQSSFRSNVPFNRI